MITSAVNHIGRGFRTILIAVLYYVVGCIFTRTGWIRNIKYWLLSLLLSSALEQIIYMLIWKHFFETAEGYGPGDVLTCALAAAVLVIFYRWIGRSNKDEDPYTRKLFTFLTPAVIAVIIMVVHILQQRENFRMKAELENQYNLQQRSYFTLLLEKEKETRRYRHDMLNHLICLQEHIKNQRYEDAEAYLEELLAQMHEIREMQYDIGNEVVKVL